MKESVGRSIVENILKSVDIRINGSQPWDMMIHDERVFRNIITQGSLGLGSAYTRGWWDSPALDEWAFRISRSPSLRTIRSFTRSIPNTLATAFEFIGNAQSMIRSQRVVKEHYEREISLFENMLDPFMQYSCAYFENSSNLNEAQVNKLKLIAQKLQLSENETLLDIGSGWGGLAKYFSENIGCFVTGINISQKQIDFSEKFSTNQKVSFQKQDYRNIHGVFDKIVSVGMFEHVGPQNYRRFMKSAHQALKPNQYFLLQTITQNESNKVCDPWIRKNIFPNSHIPSIAQISSSAENLFIIENIQNIGEHYDKTLLAWHANFVKNWPQLSNLFDLTFQRMWTYYLLTCAGAFRARELGCCQIVFKKI
jgi:cyclopropane-fatty-acyl-phospholipid synthase